MGCVLKEVETAREANWRTASMAEHPKSCPDIERAFKKQVLRNRADGVLFRVPGSTPIFSSTLSVVSVASYRAALPAIYFKRASCR